MVNINFLKNKKVLITGHTGFKGGWLSFFLKNTDCKLYGISLKPEVRSFFNQTNLKSYFFKSKFINITNFKSLDKNIKNFCPEIIFHMAAQPIVLDSYRNPLETFQTNVIGTENVMNCAIEKKVKKFIFLSTDKAVYPINAMGFTKALAEKIVISRSKDLTKNNDTKLLILRYGNVIASRGSVVRTLVNQLLNNETLTLTSKQMTRFIMSLDDAIDLLNYALKFGKQGELFVRKTPSIKIIDLIISLKKIFNKKNKIKIIGIRQGEKLHETLISEEESKNCVSKKKFFIIKPNQKNLNYEIYFSKGNRRKKNISIYSSNNQQIISITQIIQILKKEVFIKENLD